MRARVAPDQGTCEENCGVSSLLLASKQEGGGGRWRRRQERDEKERAWDGLRKKKKSFKFHCRGNEHSAVLPR